MPLRSHSVGLNAPKAICRMWNVVKKRRLTKEEEREYEEEERAELELAVGRDVMLRNEQDRARWEALYGDKGAVEIVEVHLESNAEVAVDTLPKRSTSGNGQSIDDIEMADLPSNHSDRLSHLQARPSVPVGVSFDDKSGDFPIQPREPQRLTPDLSRPDSPVDSALMNQSPSSGPNDASVATSKSGLLTTPVDTMRELNFGRYGGVTSEGAWLACIDIEHHTRHTHVEYDVDSSVAARADLNEEMEQPVSAFASTYQLEDVPLVKTEDGAILRPYAGDEPLRRDALAARYRERRITPSSRIRTSANRQNQHLIDGQDNVSTLESLETHLPLRLSRIRMHYRTNEWVEHITSANEPNLDMVSEPSSPGARADRAFEEEAIKPMHTEEQAPTQQISWSVLHVVEESCGPSTQATTSMCSQPTSGGHIVPVYGIPSTGLAVAFDRRKSGATLKGRNFAAHSRHVSAPLTSELQAEQASEDTLAGPYQHRSFSLPTDTVSAANLMDERKRRLRCKPTSLSFNALPASPNVSQVSPLDRAHSCNAHLDELYGDEVPLTMYKKLLDDEDMTLAKRKALVKRQQMHSLRQGGWAPPCCTTSANSPARQVAHYDSRQHKYADAVDTAKQSTIDLWRQSLDQEAASKRSLSVDEFARQAMLYQRRQVEWQQQVHQHERMQREAVLDVAARSGQLNFVHRDALSKMQAKVVHHAM